MQPAVRTPAVAADAAAVTEVVAALESSLYGQTTLSQADLEEEWLELDLEHDAWVVRDGERIVGYGALQKLGELWRAEGYVHPDAAGRGIGTLIATGFEQDAARRGGRRLQNSILERDAAAHGLLESLGYGAVRIFREEGVDLSKVMIGHAGDSNDLDYLTELADAGVVLGMDRFGLDLYNPTAERVKTIAALAARGYAGSMVLAHDANCFIDYFGAAHDAARAAAAPNWHYEHITDDVLPALLASGVTQEQIDTMMVENPVRYFTPAKDGAS